VGCYRSDKDLQPVFFYQGSEFRGVVEDFVAQV